MIYYVYVWKERFDGRSLEGFLLRGLKLDRVVGTVTEVIGISAVTIHMGIYCLSM